MYVDTDISEIVRVVNLYLEGLYERKFDLLEEAFWNEAKNIGVTNESKFWLKSMGFWKEKCKTPPIQYSKDERVFSLENVDVWHNSAVVKVKMIIKHPERLYECTDYLSLLKSDGQWKIYCKLWSARDIPLNN
ncbi:MAG: hypothetical protein HGN29_12355 [Asgard group archaeon]|nr:hypothetical protein [Asgard group archaeon]